MGWLYFDQYYLLLVVPAMIIALIAQIRVKSTYSQMSKIRNIRGITGVEAAQTVLTYYGITDVTIQRCQGTLSDNYNPRNKTLNLSQGVYDSDSIAAVGIACHEVGHAIQHATGYAPIKIRNFLVPVCNIGSSLGLPLAIIGYVMGFEPLVSIGLILYSFIAIFQFITLPVEFNASSRAMAAIEERGLLYDDETGKARKVLSAAAMTYVASLIVSLANLLRLVLRFGNRRR